MDGSAIGISHLNVGSKGDIEIAIPIIDFVLHIRIADKGGLAISCHVDRVNYSDNHCVRIAMLTR